MPFLPPNQQRQSTEGTVGYLLNRRKIGDHTPFEEYQISPCLAKDAQVYFIVQQNTKTSGNVFILCKARKTAKLNNQQNN